MPPSPMSTAPPTTVNPVAANTVMDLPGPQDYDAARRFIPDSKLRSYLAYKRPESHFDKVDTTSLKEVLQYLKSIISQEHLYDPKNAAVVLCDRQLEAALNVKALHLSEIRYTINLIALELIRYVFNSQQGLVKNSANISAPLCNAFAIPSLNFPATCVQCLQYCLIHIQTVKVSFTSVKVVSTLFVVIYVKTHEKLNCSGYLFSERPYNNLVMDLTPK